VLAVTDVFDGGERRRIDADGLALAGARVGEAGAAALLGRS